MTAMAPGSGPRWQLPGEETAAEEVEQGDGGELADLVAHAGQPHLHTLGIAFDADGQEDGADGLAILLGRTCDTRDAEADIGLEQLARRLRHGGRRLLGHHRALRNTEEIELDL